MRKGATIGGDWMIKGEESVFLTHHYQIEDILEKGPVCTIYRGIHRLTSKPVIIKSVDVNKYKQSGLTIDDLEREITICSLLRHEYFMQLKDAITGNKAVHMIFEYVEGSDICFEIVKRVSAGYVYSEAVASHYIRQLLEALSFMHEQGIIHRDIRPHNIVLATMDTNTPLKLRGFGVSIKIPDNTDTIQCLRVGIPQFMSPEIVAKDPYGTESDMWSVGVLMYLLLSGRLPFNGPKNHVYESILEGKYSFQGTPWNYISDDAQDLLSRLLTVDSKKRLTAQQALHHRWISDKSVPKRQHLSETVEAIRSFNINRKLKSKVISAINNSRWNKNLPSSTSFLSGDSMPGGDTCDSDYNSRYENSDAVIVTPNDTSGIERILSSLDLITVLTNPTDSNTELLEETLNNEQFKELLSLYDRISSSNIKPIAININSNSLLTESKTELNTVINPTSEALELTKLLENVHLQSIIQANDIVIEEIYTMPSQQQIDTTDIQIKPDTTTYGGPSTSSINKSSPMPPIISKTPLVDATTSSNTLPYSKTNGYVVKIQDSEIPSTSTMPMENTSVPIVEQIATLPRPDNFSSKEPQPLFADDEDDLMTNVVSRVRIIQFTKDTEEPMGITLKITEDGRCLVARIMHGGMIHRQATLHVGDEIREINGISVSNQSVETLQKLLREARGQVTFKIVPSYRSAPPACEIFVRAQFDYDPSQDDLIPCSQAGVPFKTGDILQVISKDDHNWWQSRFVCSFPALGNQPHTSSNSSTASTALISTSPTTNQTNTIAGLIPSPELQEWRTACLAMERAKDGTHCLWFNKKKKYYTTKYLRKHSDLFDQMDLVTYEEVVKLSSFRRKTLVLLGAHGVGRRHIKNTLIHRHPQKFAYPIPHTTRQPRKDEIDGKHYYFVSNDQMLTDIQNSEYLEYGTHEECMYGTKLETIRLIHKQNKIAILDVEPQALKVLRTAEYSPFVVFIAAPDLQGLQDPDGSLERLAKESEILRQAFGHLFDFVICNNDIDETIKQLELIVEKLNVIPQWVPVSWVY